MSVSEPFRLDPRLKLSFQADVRDENWALNSDYVRGTTIPTSFTLRKYEAGVALAAGLTGRLEWSSGFLVSRRNFLHAAAASEPFAGGWVFEWPNRFSYLLWDLPGRRFRLDAEALVSPGRSSAEPSRFMTTTGSLAASWLPRAKGDAWVVGSRLLAGKTFGSVPFDQYFQLGMERDNGLWLRGHVATHDGRKGNAPLGTGYTLVQNEIMRTIFHLPFLTVRCGPFYDAGWISGATGQFGSQRWMHDAGIQVKLKTTSSVTWTLVYGWDLRRGRGVFYTAASP